MIEDIQEEFSSHPTQESHEPDHAGMLLLVFITWVVFTATMVIVEKPKIVAAFKESNAIEIIKNSKNVKIDIGTTQATLYYIGMKGDSDFRLVGFKTEVRQTGASEYHDAIEGLLAGPPDSALSYGAISQIPRGTKLIGLAVSNKVAFVDFSEEFLNRPDFRMDRDYVEAARWQILKTLQATDSKVSEVVILVNGQEI